MVTETLKGHAGEKLGCGEENKQKEAFVWPHNTCVASHYFYAAWQYFLSSLTKPFSCYDTLRIEVKKKGFTLIATMQNLFKQKPTFRPGKRASSGSHSNLLNNEKRKGISPQL